MRVLLSGASGLVGRAVGQRLLGDRHTVVPLQRVSFRAKKSVWAPLESDSWHDDIGPIDAVVHLAGEPIAKRRWSISQKQRIYDSRIDGTKQLCEHLAGLDNPPSVMVSASAIGYYGDRGDEPLTEDSSSGSGFLAELCRDWEAATQSAVDAGIRVVSLRIGMVLSRDGGALARLLPLFRWGLGGKLGNGRQYVSWIDLTDLVESIMFAINTPSLSGPVNAVAPGPVTNCEFTRAFGLALGRPTWFAVPAPLLRFATGEMADQMLLSSARVEPKRLADAGFSFSHPDLASAFSHL